MTPGTRLGPYEILGFLGAGGMGEVYRGLDTRLGRLVAIKVLPREYAADPDRLRRFEQEARAAAALDHPNIVAVHDIGTSEGLPYMVEELLEGESLRDRLRGGPLPVQTAVDTAVQIAHGLAAAHEAGIVHRDLKPANVFVTQDEHVKILDFGLAKLVPAGTPGERAQATTVTGATEAGRVVGTVAYISPEQLKGQAVDQRTDIFSFGCVLYEMLTGRSPFLKPTQVETATAILHDDPEPLAAWRAQVGRGLQEIVSRCLDKQPEQRFSSAHDLALALRAGSGLMESPAVTAMPPPYRRRGRWIALGSALAALIAVLLGTVPSLRQGLSSLATAAAPSIAVLPFNNLSGDKDQEYFSDGLSEELMGLLTKVSQLHVAGRTSSFAFKGKNASLADMGRALHVGTVLEGSVRRSGDRLRVSAQLVNVADGYQIWAETYDRAMSDVFAMQDEIAAAVVAALKVALLPQDKPASSRHRTASTEAYTQYLLGNHFYNAKNRSSLERAVEAYQQAIRLDPGYAAAYAGLAVAEIDLGDYFSTPAQMSGHEAKAREAAEKAVALEPALSDGYAARGHVRNWIFPPDRSGAQADFERALALDPGDVGAHVHFSAFLLTRGRLPEAVAEAKKATSLDPLSGEAWQWLGYELLSGGDLRGARNVLTHGIEINPEDDITHYFLGLASLLGGKPEAALVEAGQRGGWAGLVIVAMAEHDLGHSSASDRALNELIVKYADTAAYQVAEVYAWRGEKDKAFEWLERAYAQHDGGLDTLQSDAPFSRLRSDPRYDALLRRMNFPRKPVR